MPVIPVKFGSEILQGLVDTGCTTTVVRTQLVTADHTGGVSAITSFDGRKVNCKGTHWMDLEVGKMPVKVKAIVADSIIEGIDIVMGLDIINQLGGVTVASGDVKFGNSTCLVVSQYGLNSRQGVTEKAESKKCIIEDKDFRAEFDGQHWTVEWVWRNNAPAALKNRVGCYEKDLKGEKREAFEREVERWIDEGILVPWKGESNGVLPLMAVEQQTKHKVRPVLDYRELNQYVMCHTGDEVTDVCHETLREWRQMKGGVKIVDLKSAYLQIKVAEKLWRYQLVNYKGKIFCLTRLGFGLNSAPRIMAKILKTVLAKREEVKRGTNSYIDDILVDVSVISVDKLINHLKEYGLVTKPPESLDGGAALGLKLLSDGGELYFRRGNELPERIDGSLTRRELFSVCGKLVGHYPVAGWLRVACSFIKRNAEGSCWDDHVGERTVSLLRQVLGRVKGNDPVNGKWYVNKQENAVIWCDASSLALGVVLEVGGFVVEDAAWLRKRDDYSHINVAELEAVMKGINLGLKWGFRSIELKTDSATVYSWIKSVITEEKRVHTKGAGEMIVKRRLGILKEFLQEFELELQVTIVPTEKNKADDLTRVNKAWLIYKKGEDEECADTFCAANLSELHNCHHMGVDRTLYLARKIDPEVTRGDVKRVVQSCERCQTIDPSPVIHDVGEVSVSKNWIRLAIDVTHYRHEPYLSMVDCGPGRLAVWRKLRRESAEEIVEELEGLFCERGPVNEVLMDNGTVFHSRLLIEMLDRWNVRRLYRAAYRPSGNGIVERHHRTIKTLAERGNIPAREAVFWYNLTPRSGQKDETVPQRSVFNYEWRQPAIAPACEESGTASVKLGEEVWVKPPNARCTTQWHRGKITKINSRNNVSVDGMPRHILDVRRIIQEPERGKYGDELQVGVDCKAEVQGVGEIEGMSDEVGEHNVEEQHSGDFVELERRYPKRERQQPAWMADYEVEVE